MTEQWPAAELDPVRRLRVTASAVRGAVVTERVVTGNVDLVWRVLTDFEVTFADIQPDMHRVRVEAHDDDQVRLRASSRFGMRARLSGTVREGWCWLQSRFLIIAMAAVPDGDQTRVALTGGIRVPGRAAIVPVGVARESAKSLDRLESVLTSIR
jgi:hypothetical protein